MKLFFSLEMELKNILIIFALFNQVQIIIFILYDSHDLYLRQHAWVDGIVRML